MANKTVPSGLKVADYLNQIADPKRRADCRRITKIMRNIVGETPKYGVVNSHRVLLVLVSIIISMTAGEKEMRFVLGSQAARRILQSILCRVIKIFPNSSLD